MVFMVIMMIFSYEGYFVKRENDFFYVFKKKVSM